MAKRAECPPIGTTFGRLTIVGVGYTHAGKTRVPVRCVCGTTTHSVVLTQIVHGRTRSCGCLRREGASFTNRTHHEAGVRETAEYRSWRGMLERCTNPKHTSYKDYGGRGITVCQRWRKYENFLADMGRRSSETSLERKNNNGNYTPTNCVWLDKRKQARNQRRTKCITYKGITLSRSEWAERLGISYWTLRNRYDCGLTPAQILDPTVHTSWYTKRRAT